MSQPAEPLVLVRNPLLIVLARRFVGRGRPVHDHLVAKPEADASPILEPVRIGDRVRRDGAEVKDRTLYWL